jgi:alpha-L-rhamnosidase
MRNISRRFDATQALDQPDGGARVGATDRELIGTAFFAHSTELAARTARLLGKTRDARRYAALHQRIVYTFRREFLTPGGRLASNTQTAYVLALQFDLLPERSRAGVLQRLVDDIRRRGNHLSTGFLGTPYLCHVLSRFGCLDLAYDLLLQEDYPSWLYPVKQGATTIWERWDGRRPDGTFQTPSMNSFNHYAYGAIGDWLYRVVGGLDTDPGQPGYKRILIQPQPGGGLTHARVSLESQYGRIEAAWKIDSGFFSLAVTVPPNTAAGLDLPRALADQVTEGGAPLKAAPGLLSVQPSAASLSVEIGSGQYTFVYPWPGAEADSVHGGGARKSVLQ